MTSHPSLRLLLSLLFLAPPAIAEETTRTAGQFCQHNPSATLFELEKEGAKQGIFFSDPQVPKDLRLDQKPYKYLVINPTAVRNLPSKSAPSAMNYMPPHRGAAACRVLGLDGTWWYVERMPPHGGLVYINGQDIELQTTDR
jgi:hypothetical protein